MLRLSLASLALAALLTGSAFLLLGMFSADPKATHIGCPPGSHGKLWSADHGRMFKGAERTRGAQSRQSEPPLLGDRAVTAPIGQR